MSNDRSPWGDVSDLVSGIEEGVSQVCEDQSRKEIPYGVSSSEFSTAIQDNQGDEFIW